MTDHPLAPFIAEEFGVTKTVTGARIVTPNLAAEAATLRESARDYADASHADSTRDAYAGDWHRFVSWCRNFSRSPLPSEPSTVVLYLTHLADSGKKASTIDRALSAISQWHKAAGFPSPRSDAAVAKIRKGIRRTIGVAQKKKAPLLVDDIRNAFAELPEGKQGARDRAIIALGFAGAFRRSEVVSLSVDNLEFTDDGLIVHLGRSKGDQEGVGEKLAIPHGRKATCPVRLMKAWLEVSGIKDGPVFRAVSKSGRVSRDALSDKTVSNIVKRAALRIGCDPRKFGGHSLRAGFVTAAAKSSKPLHAIKKQTRHKSVDVLMGYIRDAKLFEDNAAEGLL